MILTSTVAHCVTLPSLSPPVGSTREAEAFRCWGKQLQMSPARTHARLGTNRDISSLFNHFNTAKRCVDSRPSMRNRSNFKEGDGILQTVNVWTWQCFWEVPGFKVMGQGVSLGLEGVRLKFIVIMMYNSPVSQVLKKNRRRVSLLYTGQRSRNKKPAAEPIP